MPRPIKYGLDYFNLDVDFYQDIKMRKLVRSQGGKAIAVYVLLLGFIYKKGYYMRWDPELPFIISEITGFEEVYIQEAIKYCLSVGLFSKELFEKEEVLTSEEIQKNYNQVSARRSSFIKEYSLLSAEDTGVIVTETPVIVTETPVIVTETPVNVAISTQSKVKESKEKKEISPDGDTKKAPEGLSSPSAHKPVFPYEKIVGMWNTTCTGYHKLTGLSEKRKMKLKNRIEEISKTGEPLLLFQTLFEKMQNSSFLKGDNRRGWKATFDWLISNGENWRKVLEGNYDNEFMSNNGSYYDTGRNRAEECKVSSRKPGECSEKSVRIPTETDYPSTL